MKKNSKMILAAVGTAVMAAGMLAGCGSSSKETTAAQTTTVADSKAADTTEAKKEEKTEAAADLSGTISMVGSTSMEKFANALSETFMENILRSL